MSDRAVARTRPRGDAAVTELLPDQSAREIVTASAQLLYGAAREAYAVQYKTWQEELWAYTKTVGEYGGVMDWFAAGISRMHLTAAVWRPRLREPELIEDDADPSVRAIQRLVANARHGETQYMYKWGRQLGTPGIGYFVAYEDADAQEIFDCKSAKQIRISTKPFKTGDGRTARDQAGREYTGFDLRTDPDRWIKLPYNSLVGRIFRPDDELDYEVTSWSRPALTTLREIDLFNRHIVATLLSRLVFNGILFIPEEVTFPANPEFKEAPDPFIAELIAVASRGIKDPGSPASAIPFPLRVKSEFIEKFKHLIISTGIDPKIIEARDSAVKRLSEQLPAPPEAMTGNAGQNHWNAWKTSEDNVKYYFGPTMEILCGGIDEVYHRPALRSENVPLDMPDGGRRVCWYDASDLIATPDNSENAKDAHLNAVIGDDAYLKELNLDKADKATKKDRRTIILTQLAAKGLPAPDSYYLLFPEDKPDPIQQAQDQAAAQKVLIDSGVAPDPTQPVPGRIGAPGGATPGAAKAAQPAQKGPPNAGKTPALDAKPAARAATSPTGGNRGAR